MSEHIAEVSRGMPRLIVASRVIEKIKRGALLYPEPETGEAMIGLIVPQTGQAEPDIYIFDTISPGDRAIREWGMFEQGDDWQADVFNWLWINWEAYRSLRRGSYGRAVAAKWDAPLQHVGDWHKQPDDMIAPSGGDAQTARRMIDDRDTTVEHIVAPIVTMYPLAKATPVTDEKEQQSSEKSSASTDNASNDSTEVDSDQPTQSDHHPASNSTNTEMTSAGSATITGETLRARGYPSPPPLVANALQFTLEEDGWIVRVDFW